MTDEAIDRPLARLLVWALPIFVLHVIEEAPGFVEWMNAHVEPDISAPLFWSVNFGGLLLTALVVGVAWSAPAALAQVVATAWFSFVMLANAILHLTAAVVDRSYAPGAITAALLYLPFFSWMMVGIARRRAVRWELLLFVAALGALPMLIHGYRIVFLGGRLF